MRARDIRDALLGVQDDALVTISVDVSTGEADATDRAFADDLAGVQVDHGVVTLLTIGALNTKKNTKKRR